VALACAPRELPVASARLPTDGRWIGGAPDDSEAQAMSSDYEIDPAGDAEATPETPRNSTNLIAKAARAILAAHVGRIPVSGLIGAVALVALIAGAYTVGNPGDTSTQNHRLSSSDVYPAASAAPAVPAVGAPIYDKGLVTGQPGAVAGDGSTPESGVSSGAPVTTPQIVKTGSMSVEVSELDKAVGQAQTAIIGLGGSVSQSNQSGDKESAVASVVYRVPADKFDAAQAAIRGIAGRVLSAQTSTNDVTAQVVDLEARLANLQATESALQSIMARATLIADVLAVEQQLSNTQGQIEQLTAQRDYLKNQAAMSTLAVTFSLPSKTVTTQATQGWDLGAQIDDAGAALVRIGQGLATLGVWAVVVGLPVVIGIGLLLAVLWILRRVAGRKRGSPAQA
jgi:hypothetical protein